MFGILTYTLPPRMSYPLQYSYTGSGIIHNYARLYEIMSPAKLLANDRWFVVQEIVDCQERLHSQTRGQEN
jgi:hypothetical protein